jgi:parvulin-like peptidyl-prolyl isomerase
MAPPKTAPKTKADPKKTPAASRRASGPVLSTREAVRLRGPSLRQISRRDREQRMRRLIVILAGALAAVILLVLGFGYWRENVVRAQETAAVIFGESITADELLRRTRPQLADFDQRIAAFRANGLTQQAAQMQMQRATMPQSVLNALIEDKVIRREASSRGVSVTPEEVDARLRQVVANRDAANNPAPAPTPAPPAPTAVGTPTPRPTATPIPTLTSDRYGPALQDLLNQTGYQEESLREALESALYEEKLRAAIGEEVPAVQEQVRARQIVLKTKEEADAALEQLRGGAAFEELAASQSQDSATKDKGGDLGWLPKMGRDISFDETLFALEPGQLSEAVQTLSGWSIIQVLERDPARPVEAQQLETLRSQRYSNWLTVAIGSPEIERKLSPEMSEWVLKHVGGRRAA